MREYAVANPQKQPWDTSFVIFLTICPQGCIVQDTAADCKPFLQVFRRFLRFFRLRFLLRQRSGVMLRFHDVAVVLYIAAVDFPAVVIAKTLHSEAAFQHIFTELTNDLLQLRFERGLFSSSGPRGHQVCQNSFPLRPKSMRTQPTAPRRLFSSGCWA